MTTSFSGLGLHLGNLSRLVERARPARSARRTSPARRAGAAWRPRAPGARPARGLGQGWKVSPSVRIEAGETFVARRHRGIGRDPADLDDARQRALARPDPAHLLGRPGAPLGRGAARRLLRLRLGPVRAGQLARRSASIPARAFNCYWEMPFRKRARITLENRDPDDHASSTTRSTTRSPTCPTTPPISTPSSGAPTRCRSRQDYVILDGVQGPGPLRRHLHGLGSRTTPAGGAKARSSSSWTATASSRPSAAPAPRTISAAPTISMPAPSTQRSRAPTSSSPRPMPGCRR